MSKKSITMLVVVIALACSMAFAKTIQKPRNVQKVSVNLERDGYRPESFKLRRGVRAEVTFIRKTEDSCGRVIVMPAYGVHRDLPLNQPVTITFTPRKSGTFNFTCGMDMLRGKIIVN